MNANELISVLIVAELDLSGDTQRIIREEREALQVAVKGHVAAQIAAAMAEAKRVAKLWGVDIVSRPKAREFLSIPSTAMPRVEWLDSNDAEDLGDPWESLREFAAGKDTGAAAGSRVELTADYAGWRDGVRITIR